MTLTGEFMYDSGHIYGRRADSSLRTSYAVHLRLLAENLEAM